MKLIVIGPARSGKDTVCELLQRNHGVTFASSSRYALKFVAPILDTLGELKSPEQHYSERMQHRALWYEIICYYNHADPARLAKDLLAHYDVYCGMRSRIELASARKLVDKVIWVDRKLDEPGASMTILKSDADIVLDNTSSLDVLERRVSDLYENLSGELNENFASSTLADALGLCELVERGGHRG